MPDSHILLGVNIDHCATLRQARYRENPQDRGRMIEPDPLFFALAAEQAGAEGITVHLREDRRHIQESDVWAIRNGIQTRLNLEMACTDEMLEFALKLKPDSACLVPESREEVTTEGGLDVVGHKVRVAHIVTELNKAGIVTSLFIDPDHAQVSASAEVGSPWIELHTGAFSNAWYDPSARARELEKLIGASNQAHHLGLTVNAGHGINYNNIRDIISIPWLHELNIGHSIVSRSLYSGVTEAVQRMKALMRGLP